MTALANLRQYIQTANRGGADKYHGAVAQGYDAKRENSQKWIAEQALVESMLDDIHEGQWVLDIPVGTGRFLPFYKERRVIVRGGDKSMDMLAVAAEKADALGFDPRKLILAQADVTNLDGLQDKSTDYAVMVRLTRWLAPDQCVAALKELQRVTRKKIVFTARVSNHPEARPYELIDSALDGWEIARDEGLPGDEDYRVIALCPTI